MSTTTTNRGNRPTIDTGDSDSRKPAVRGSECVVRCEAIAVRFSDEVWWVWAR